MTLTFSGPESYFGMWWSAADANNAVSLYSGTTLLATYNSTSAFAGLPSSYFGNPNSGADAGEMFAYVNFNATEGTAITSVVFSNNGTTATGFEADNFSVLNVPEPSTLVLFGTALVIGGVVIGRRAEWAGSGDLRRDSWLNRRPSACTCQRTKGIAELILANFLHILFHCGLRVDQARRRFSR